MNVHVYNDVWNCDDDGLVNGYDHVWKYMMIVIDHKHDITWYGWIHKWVIVWYLEFDVESRLWMKVWVCHNSFSVCIDVRNQYWRFILIL